MHLWWHHWEAKRQLMVLARQSSCKFHFKKKIVKKMLKISIISISSNLFPFMKNKIPLIACIIIGGGIRGKTDIDGGKCCCTGPWSVCKDKDGMRGIVAPRFCDSLKILLSNSVTERAPKKSQFLIALFHYE